MPFLHFHRDISDTSVVMVGKSNRPNGLFQIRIFQTDEQLRLGLHIELARMLKRHLPLLLNCHLLLLQSVIVDSTQRLRVILSVQPLIGIIFGAVVTNLMADCCFLRFCLAGMQFLLAGNQRFFGQRLLENFLRLAGILSGFVGVDERVLEGGSGG